MQPNTGLRSTSNTMQKRNACPPMPNELWQDIFGKILEETRRSHTILPFMLVCKRWKNAGWKLLYRNLYFSNTESLKAFHVHLMSEAVRGSTPALLSEAMILNMGYQEFPKDLVCRILLYTSKLKSFSAPNDLICTLVLEYLSHGVRETLKELRLTLCTHHDDGASNLGLVGRFEGLDRLSVTGCWSDTSDSTSFVTSRAVGFCMPSLKELSWSAPTWDRPPDPGFLTFLSRCEFWSLTSLALHLPNIDSQTTLVLKPFFEKFGTQLHRLRLEAPPDAMLPNVMLPFTTNLMHLGFFKHFPGPGAMSSLPTNVGRLILQPEDGDDSDKLLEFLMELEFGLPPNSGLRFVQLLDVDKGPFGWKEVVQRAGAYVAGHLMDKSIRLATKGIQLQDRFGDTLGIICGGDT